MGIYDGQIDPPPPEIEECPECEQMHRWREDCPETPLAESKVSGIDIITSEIQKGRWHTVISGGTWDCLAEDSMRREDALVRHYAVVELVAEAKCRGADDEPDCSHCPYAP